MMESYPYTSFRLHYVTLPCTQRIRLSLFFMTVPPGLMGLWRFRPNAGLRPPGSDILFLGWTSYIFTTTEPSDELGASTTFMSHLCGVPVKENSGMCGPIKDRING